MVNALRGWVLVQSRGGARYNFSGSFNENTLYWRAIQVRCLAREFFFDRRSSSTGQNNVIESGRPPVDHHQYMTEIKGSIPVSAKLHFKRYRMRQIECETF